MDINEYINLYKKEGYEYADAVAKVAKMLLF